MKYYVLVEPWAVYVKEADFFVAQGGLTAEWGKRWKLLEAPSMEFARRIAKESCADA